MAGNSVPDRVTNKILYKELMTMQTNIMEEINAFKLSTEHRLSVIETCVESQKTDVDMLKRRDIFTGSIAAALSIVGAILKDIFIREV